MPGGTKTNFTYKRKVYPQEEIGDYKNAQDSAVKKLGRIEQSGQSSEKVAAFIYEKCTQKSGKYLFAVGIKNKAIRALMRVLPQRVLSLLTRNVYLTPDA